MKLSLIISTLGRTHELGRLLDSLAMQTMTDFEVLIVDQNESDILGTMLRSGNWPFPVRHLRAAGERGLSRGRNHGWPCARGEVVLFPDDDCWYPHDLFAMALSRMGDSGVDIVTGRATDESGRSINGRYESEAQFVTRRNVWTTQIEWMVFFRRTVLDAVGGYDERVGVGAASPWQACEGQDIVLRALESGFSAWFDPSLHGHHAELDTIRPSAFMRRKARGYARGLGYVLRKHGYGPGIAAYWAARPVVRALIAASRGNIAQTRYYAGVSLGRVEGFLRVNRR